MRVVKVTGTVECDGCGSYFDIELDAALSTEGYSIWDHVIDQVRDSIWCSIKDDKIFCVACTRKNDEKDEQKQ